MRDLPIDRIMTTNPETVSPGDSAAVLRDKLDAGPLHHLPVVDDGKLVGIVSSSDLMKLFLLDDARSAPAQVRHIMERDPLVLPSTANMREAAQKLSLGGFHALPVVEPDSTLVGIVTSSDLIDYLLKQLPRGDGSIHEVHRIDGKHAVGDDEIRDALDTAEKSEASGAANDPLSRVLLHFRDSNRKLKAVCQAAELYMRSGHGEHEHSVLLKRLADVRYDESTTL